MSKSTDGPIVDAVRLARREIARECWFDLERLFDMLQERERKAGIGTGSPRRTRSRLRPARATESDDDGVVADVRAARRELARRHGYDITRLCKAIGQHEKRRPAKTGSPRRMAGRGSR
jgi:hypothetical protein